MEGTMDEKRDKKKRPNMKMRGMRVRRKIKTKERRKLRQWYGSLQVADLPECDW